MLCLFRTSPSPHRVLESKMTTREFEDYPSEDAVRALDNMLEPHMHGGRKTVSLVCLQSLGLCYNLLLLEFLL